MKVLLEKWRRFSETTEKEPTEREKRDKAFPGYDDLRQLGVGIIAESDGEDKVLIDYDALMRLMDAYEEQELTLDEGSPQQQCNRRGFYSLKQWLLRHSAFIDASKGNLTIDKKAKK